jgi:hypothetical protein
MTYLRLAPSCRRRAAGAAALLLLTLLASCAARPSPTPAPTATAPIAVVTPSGTQDPGRLATPRPREELLEAVPALAEREARFASALASDQPILTLESGLDDRQRAAQDLVVADPQFQSLARDPNTNQPVRSEIMIVRPALPTDLTTTTASRCAREACYRVEMYNYAANATTVALVNINDRSLVEITYNPDVQPELPPYLAALAAQIAINSPEVAAELGFKPGAGLAGMPGVKTALNNSQCERSRHLCVGPTFLLREQGKALWAIVDLTEGRLVGTRWTDTGAGEGQPVTEQSLQDAVVMANYCEVQTALNRDGWEMSYSIASSDGLEIRGVKFSGRPVLDSAKLVDWHVSYSGPEGFGYSDATGCPLFSTASVVAFNGPVVEDIVEEGAVVGFALLQDFRSELWPLSCNYRYVQRYEFYRDGRFRVGALNLGRGCGNNGTYHPVVRMALNPGAQGDSTTIAEWDGAQWVTWEEEQWTQQTDQTPYTEEGYQFRILGGDGTGYMLQPNTGQLPDGPRGDNAFVYATLRKAEEGDADMITIGPCCNTDHQQGPERFMQPPEPIADSRLVLWYVPRLKNDDAPGQEYCWTSSVVENGLIRHNAYPCAFGPMFVPVK